MEILRTSRLRLRWFTVDDAPFVLELVTDPGWIAFINDKGPRTLDAVRVWIEARLIAHYHQHGFGLWAVERLSDGAPVGMCGLVRRPSLPTLDVGYALLAGERGHGYAREAAAACLAYAHNLLGQARVLAIMTPENVASARVLESVGMRLVETRALEGETRVSAVWETRAGF